jgi:hypothetical protein
MGALKDCETVVDAFWGQPVNSISALAFVLGGALIIARSPHIWIGLASIATGIGSFLFHGPMPPLSQWVHDLTLAWLLLVVAAHGRSWERWAHIPGLIVVAILVAIPGAANPVGVALAALAIVLIVMRDRSVATLGPLVLVVAVAIIGRLGATGGPLCDPDSLLQPHGIWHLGAAVAVTWWALGRGALTSR